MKPLYYEFLDFIYVFKFFFKINIRKCSSVPFEFREKLRKLKCTPTFDRNRWQVPESHNGRGGLLDESGESNWETSLSDYFIFIKRLLSVCSYIKYYKSLSHYLVDNNKNILYSVNNWFNRGSQRRKCISIMFWLRLWFFLHITQYIIQCPSISGSILLSPS